MSHHGSITGQRTRALTALLSGALVLSLALGLAAPAAAAGPLKLTAGNADPTTGTAGERFAFAVTYISKDDERPVFVRVIVGGTAHDLAQVSTSDTDMRDGARYRIRFTIRTPGTYAYRFVARDAKGREVSLEGGTVTVKPKPKPKPTPAPKPDPVSSDTSPSTGPTSRPDVVAPATVTADASAGRDDEWWPLEPDESDPGAAGSAVAATLAGPTGGDGRPPGPGSGGGPGIGDREPSGVGDREPPPARPLVGIAALTVGLPGLGSDAWLELAARSALVTTASAAVVAMALFTFRRRRDDEEPFGDADRDRRPDDQGSGAPIDPALVGEMAMPRWRRPSLNQARKADPIGNAAIMAAERLTFADDGLGGSALERRRIRYRMVRLADSPDELTGHEIGRLDQGDEIELIEQSGLYWKIRTPLGQVGWVHKMTLGEAVTAQLEAIDEAADADVLAAFSEAQRHRAFQPQVEPVLGEGLAARFIRERSAS